MIRTDAIKKELDITAAPPAVRRFERGIDAVEHLRSEGWASTPLGSRESWPHVLRVIVDIMRGASQAMLTIWGPERFALYNEALAGVLVSRRPPSDLVCELEAELAPVVEGVFAGEPIRTQETRLVSGHDGVVEFEIDLRVSITPLRDDDGHVRGVFCVCQDITPEVSAKRAQTELRDSERRLRATFDNAAVGLAHIALDGAILRVNDRFCEITGYSREELTAKTFQDITHPSDVAPDVSQSRALFDGTIDRYEMEKRYVRKDGSPVWVHLTASLTRSDQGEPAYGIAVVQDIDARKRLESSLRQSEERLRLATEGARLGLIDMDPTTSTAVWSDRMSAIYGLASDSPSYFDPIVAGMIHPDDFARVRAKALAAWDPKGDGLFEDEHRITRPDGDVRWVFVRGQVLFEGEGAKRRPSRAYGAVLDVTDRKRSEEALRASEERFRLATEAMHGLLYDWDVTTGKLFYSAGLFELIGIRPEEEAASVSSWLERVHPEDQATVRGRLEEALSARAPATTLEYRVRHRDGRYLWVWDHTRGVYDDAGRPRRFVGFVVSIDDRKRAESNATFLSRLHSVMVQESNPDELAREVLAAVAEHLSVDSAWIGERMPGSSVVIHRHHDRDGRTSVPGPHRLMDCLSDEARATFGSDRCVRVDDVATDPRTAAHGESFRRAEVGAFLSESLMGAERTTVLVGVTSRQARKWRSDEAQLLQDVAVRLVAALERVRSAAALREGERQFKKMADTAPAMLWMTGPEQHIILVSRGWYDFTGQAEGAALGEGWLDAIHPEDRERVKQACARAAERGEPFTIDYRVRRRDGVYRWVIDSGRPRSSDTGEIAGHVGSVIDVHERKLAEEALREADRRKDEYLAMLGHELRNPLAAIQTATELLRLTKTDDTRLLRAYGVLERQSTHMVKLIEGLLEVSRIARGKIRLEKQVVDLRQTLERVLADRSVQLASRGLELKKSFSSEPLWVSADPIRLVQVFDNLVGNAVKFTEPPGTISVTLERGAARGIVRIRDTGAGIRPEMLASIFEPFQQDTRDISRAAGGLGLGLALAKGLVELHDGTIEARSAGPGTGAELQVQLPLVRHVSTPTCDERVGPRRVSAPSRHILIVEDNADAAQMLRDLLEMEGHHVSVVENGIDALEALHHDKADVVICDIGLPGMSGYELARAIRSDDSLHDIDLVALTGYGQPEDRERTRDAGFDEHLTKPLALPVLERVLERRAHRGGAPAAAG